MENMYMVPEPSLWNKAGSENPESDPCSLCSGLLSLSFHLKHVISKCVYMQVHSHVHIYFSLSAPSQMNGNILYIIFSPCFLLLLFLGDHTMQVYRDILYVFFAAISYFIVCD